MKTRILEVLDTKEALRPEMHALLTKTMQALDRSLKEIEETVLKGIALTERGDAELAATDLLMQQCSDILNRGK